MRNLTQILMQKWGRADLRPVFNKHSLMLTSSAMMAMLLIGCSEDDDDDEIAAVEVEGEGAAVLLPGASATDSSDDVTVTIDETGAITFSSNNNGYYATSDGFDHTTGTEDVVNITNIYVAGDASTNLVAYLGIITSEDEVISLVSALVGDDPNKVNFTVTSEDSEGVVVVTTVTLDPANLTQWIEVASEDDSEEVAVIAIGDFGVSLSEITDPDPENSDIYYSMTIEDIEEGGDYELKDIILDVEEILKMAGFDTSKFVVQLDDLTYLTLEDLTDVTLSLWAPPDWDPDIQESGDLYFAANLPVEFGEGAASQVLIAGMLDMGNEIFVFAATDGDFSGVNLYNSGSPVLEDSLDLLDLDGDYQIILENIDNPFSDEGDDDDDDIVSTSIKFAGADNYDSIPLAGLYLNDVHSGFDTVTGVMVVNFNETPEDDKDDYTAGFLGLAEDDDTGDVAVVKITAIAGLDGVFSGALFDYQQDAGNAAEADNVATMAYAVAATFDDGVTIQHSAAAGIAKMQVDLYGSNTDGFVDYGIRFSEGNEGYVFKSDDADDFYVIYREMDVTPLHGSLDYKDGSSDGGLFSGVGYFNMMYLNDVAAGTAPDITFYLDVDEDGSFSESFSAAELVGKDALGLVSDFLGGGSYQDYADGLKVNSMDFLHLNKNGLDPYISNNYSGYSGDVIMIQSEDPDHSDVWDVLADDKILTAICNSGENVVYLQQGHGPDEPPYHVYYNYVDGDLDIASYAFTVFPPSLDNGGVALLPQFTDIIVADTASSEWNSDEIITISGEYGYNTLKANPVAAGPSIPLDSCGTLVDVGISINFDDERSKLFLDGDSLKFKDTADNDLVFSYYVPDDGIE